MKQASAKPTAAMSAFFDYLNGKAAATDNAEAEPPEPTHPRSVWLTDAEWLELQRRGVRGGKGSLAHWLGRNASTDAG